MFGFVLILFIPGFAISLVLYPKKNEISYSKRIGLSIVLSIISVILIVLFIDGALAVNTTPLNVAVTILIFSLFVVCIWRVKLHLDEIIPIYFSGKESAGKNILPLNTSKLKLRLKAGDTDAIDEKTLTEGMNNDL